MSSEVEQRELQELNQRERAVQKHQSSNARVQRLRTQMRQSKHAMREHTHRTTKRLQQGRYRAKTEGVSTTGHTIGGKTSE
eukprot:3340110-Amphidinium_carterae.1